jgi:hypothetical protein
MLNMKVHIAMTVKSLTQRNVYFLIGAKINLILALPNIQLSQQQPLKAYSNEYNVY